ADGFISPAPGAPRVGWRAVRSRAIAMVVLAAVILAGCGSKTTVTKTVTRTVTTGPSLARGRVVDCLTFNNHKLAQVTTGGRLKISNGTGVPGFRSGHTPVVAYGSKWTHGSFTCLSASTGVTCYSNVNKHGFTIDRGGITRYPAPAAPPSSSSRAEYVLSDA